MLHDPCPNCGRRFDHRSPKQIYCDRKCFFDSRRGWRLDTRLKQRMMGQVRACNVSPKHACKLIGVHYSAISAWFKRPKGGLRGANLAAVASWLGLTTKEAGDLQDGTVQARHREIALENLTEFRRKSKEDPALRAAVVEKMAAAVRGKPFSQEHKARLSVAIKDYRQRPGAHRLGDHNKTLRGRAQNILKTLHRHHPDWSRTELEDAVVSRLMQPPYDLGSARAARMLLEPVRVAGPGRPSNTRRCALVASELEKLPPARRRDVPWGTWPAIADRVSELEAIDPKLEGDSIKRWKMRHGPHPGCRIRAVGA